MCGWYFFGDAPPKRQYSMGEPPIGMLNDATLAIVHV
jgi:hypothetical protein